jgi:L-amino acid N-acyltransferase YncA
VVEQGGQLLGWLSFSSFYARPAYARTAEISIYLAASARGQGLGSYLLATALKAAPALELDNLLGFIFAHNSASLALFERFGFQRWGHLPRVAVLDGVERDVLIVGLRLAD